MQEDKYEKIVVIFMYYIAQYIPIYFLPYSEKHQKLGELEVTFRRKVPIRFGNRNILSTSFPVLLKEKPK